MSGRGRKYRGMGGRRAQGGRCLGRGNSYSININNLNNNNKGLCSALGHHVFDYGQKEATYQTRKTWDKIVNHAGTIYGHNISNELNNKKQIEITQHEHTHKVKDRHLERVERLRD